MATIGSLADGAQRDPGDPARTSEVRDLYSLFGESFWGWNHLLAVAYLIGLELTLVPLVLPSILAGDALPFEPLSWFGTTLVMNVLEAGAFAIIMHHFRSDLLRPLFWGAISALVGIGFRATLNLLPLATRLTGSPAEALIPFTDFVQGLLFMLGLVLAVRLRGAGFRSLVSGATVGYAISPGLLYLAGLLPRVTWIDFLIAMLDGIVVGTLVAIAVITHIRYRGFRVVRGTIIDSISEEGWSTTRTGLPEDRPCDHEWIRSISEEGLRLHVSTRCRNCGVEMSHTRAAQHDLR